MGRKKQNPAESDKRRLILKVAARMFMVQGYHAVSMDALAGAVPVSKRTLYNHFEDKKALFTAVMQNRCHSIFEALEQTMKDHQSPEQLLTSIGRKFLDVVFEPDAINMYRTAITEAQHFPELGELFYESGPKRATVMLAECLSRMHKEHALYVPNPKLAAMVFLGMLTNRMQMKCMLGLKKKVSAVEKEEIMRYAVGVFLHGQQVS